MIDLEKQLIIEFLEYYFNTRKFQYSKTDLQQHEALINLGVLNEVESNKNLLEIQSNSINLQKVVLEVAESKLERELPKDFIEGFEFIDDFDKHLKKEYHSEKGLNAFSYILKGFRGYVLFTLHQEGLDVKNYILTLDANERKNHLYSKISSFFQFILYFDYSEKEIFEILNGLNKDENKKFDVVSELRKLPAKDIEKSKLILKYAYTNNEPLYFISELLIGLYNAGETSILPKLLELRERDYISCLIVLSRVSFRNTQDLEKAVGQIGELDFQDLEVASNQANLIIHILESEFLTEELRITLFGFLIDYLNRGNESIVNSVFGQIHLMDGNEREKYNLLFVYLNKTKNLSVMKEFFTRFNDPTYIFDTMIRLFEQFPNYRFSMDLFENGLRHAWLVNQDKTHDLILELFKIHPVFGILGVKILFTSYSGIFQVDFLRLEKAEYQINAIDSICKHPHSFDKLLPLILPLRNSKLKGVREHLQNSLAYLVFKSYHSTLYNQIESGLGNHKKDKQFIEPIKKALDDYNKLKELKGSINDLNPYENERELIDFYYALEQEEHTKMMNELRTGEGSFLEMAKNVIIVRGNSFMIGEGEISPLGRVESSVMVDGSSYLNPDLYELNLNLIHEH